MSGDLDTTKEAEVDFSKGKQFVVTTRTIHGIPADETIEVLSYFGGSTFETASGVYFKREIEGTVRTWLVPKAFLRECEGILQAA